MLCLKAAQKEAGFRRHGDLIKDGGRRRGTDVIKQESTILKLSVSSGFASVENSLVVLAKA